MAYKFCNKCQTKKSVLDFNKRTKSIDGLSAKCRVCQNAYDKARNALPEIAAINNQRAKEYNKNHKQAIAKYQSDLYLEQKVDRQKWAKQYYIDNKESHIAYSIKWQRENKEAVAKRNTKWKAENKGKVTACGAKRRAAKLRATPLWADLAAIEKVYQEAAKKGLSVDHVLPLQGKLVSGLHVANNLQLLTGVENSAKGNSFNEVW